MLHPYLRKVQISSSERRSVIKLAGSPVQGMVREMFGSALTMARLGLQNLGVSEGEIEEAEQSYRTVDRERLRLQQAAGNIYAARDAIIIEPRSRAQRGADSGSEAG